MARLAHNDFLQQASDSGWVGFAAYLAFVCSAMARGYRAVPKELTSIPFAIWLGLLGWFLQGFLEFSLYIPALAWPAFALLGLITPTYEPRSRSHP